MNYLSHAYLAELEYPDPTFILGAMLPDLTGLAQVVGSRSQLPGPLGLGIRFHHESDRAFHGHADFVNGQAELIRRLLEQSVRKGPSRALAHIGIEFLVDAGLALRVHGYFHALNEGTHGSAFRSFPEEDQTRLKHLCTYLLERGREPFQITEGTLSVRLARTLEGRPRLAPTPSELRIATNELLAISELWGGKAHELSLAILAEVRAGNWQNVEKTGTLGPSNETPPC